jgi:hypothetical protein
LIAGVVLVFGSLAAYVAFNGSPIGGSTEAGSNEVVVETGARAPKLAVTALADAAQGVARDRAAQAGAASAAPGGGGGGAQPEPDAGAGAAAPTGAGIAPGTDSAAPPQPGTTAPTSTAPTAGQSPSPTAPTSGSGPVGNTVQGGDDATGLDLGQSTPPVTGPVDEALGNVQSGAQGLGDTVNDATGGLLDP